MSEAIKVGAVVYAPQVTVVWEIISDFFAEEGQPLEMVYFKDYRAQVQALLAGEIDIAWNSPLAHVEATLRSKEVGYSAMRDTDRDRRSVYLAKTDSGINTVEDFRGKTIGFGAVDSPQARLVPIADLLEKGLDLDNDYKEVTFDKDLGFDGDHVGGEHLALDALKVGDVDVSVTTEGNYDEWVQDGSINEKEIKIVDKTGLYDHCIFTTRPNFPQETKEKWEAILEKMDYDNPKHKEMMDLEGLKKWVPGRTDYFALCEKGVARTDLFHLNH
ncbi:MAG: PhnD/SsuA/transferrin family substrate-binding protein [Aerococcus sp.]|nr:PhnD/SsuA/transferrin family substrate-binding protein [Aerococcus sp.]